MSGGLPIGRALTPEEERVLLNRLFDSLMWQSPIVNPDSLGQVEPPANYLREGLLAYANGTDWDPKSLDVPAGLYRYDGSVWWQMAESEGWDDLRIAATAQKIGGSSPTWGQFPFTGSHGLKTWVFPNSGTADVHFDFQLPHGWWQGTDIKPHIHWAPSSTNTGNIKWFLEYAWANYLGVFTSTPATISVIQAASGTIDKHDIAAFDAIDGTGKELSSVLVCRLYRNPADADDTFTGDAAYLSADAHIQFDRPAGSRQEYIK